MKRGMDNLPDQQIDTLDAEAFSPLGARPLLMLDANDLPGVLPPAVLIAVDRTGALPELDPVRFDALVTTHSNAPAPWVSVAPERLATQLDQVRKVAGSAPIATAILARVLRIGELLPFEDALEVQSLAYSALLGGAEFGRWHSAQSFGEASAGGAVRYERDGELVTLTLASPDNDNAMTAAMRDALYEALANVLDDPSAPRLVLKGEGRCFSTAEGTCPNSALPPTSRRPTQSVRSEAAQGCYTGWATAPKCTCTEPVSARASKCPQRRRGALERQAHLCNCPNCGWG